MSQLTSEIKGANIYEVVKWGEEILKGYEKPDATIDARLLLRHLLGFNETELLLNREMIVPAHVRESYVYLIAKRSQGTPLQYITKNQDFMGLNFYVDDRVLIPRQDTETLVETLIQMSKSEPIKEGIDIGTGSGCISIALAHYIENLNMTALDISEAALDVAKKNVKMHGLENKICCIKSDLLKNYPQDQEKVDLIVSNPPYISKKECGELMQEVRNYEPQIALTDGLDGLTFYRNISKEAKALLKPYGIIAYEIGYNQSQEVTTILEQEGFIEVETLKDLAGKDRVVIARNNF